jgi:hypothetical protein
MRLQARNNTMELQADVSQSDVMDRPANHSILNVLHVARTLHSDVELSPWHEPLAEVGS